ncbi:hypothetical protein PtA15_6A151 [Puccinia triticina]|uniref:Uncharacterized protein n=1 Tax=Puccinia triticina TaxID=208348 RepID=A0ABY7CJW6_9BASI|nr:uncharacterized protein PtA15_6A151 [Puccinia triticina]WAQ85523.1 hypothetical protein PtA15_6A151 [Puccinia triticina]
MFSGCTRGISVGPGPAEGDTCPIGAVTNAAGYKPVIQQGTFGSAPPYNI